MRIAVTGEGPTDYGKVDYGNPGHWIDGRRLNCNVGILMD